MKAAKLRGSSWAYLPDDIVGRIAEHLGFIDFLQFRFVCRPWKHAVVSCRSLPRSPQTPWLMFSGYFDEIGFLDIFIGKIYKPILGGRSGAEALRRWQVAGDHRLGWHPICNPLIGGHQHKQRQQLLLYGIPIDGVPFLPGTPASIKSLKLIPLLSTTTNSQPTMMATLTVLYEGYNILFFAKAGGTSWTRLREGQFEDTIAYNGCLYAFQEGKVDCWDIGNAELMLWTSLEVDLEWELYNKFFVATPARLLLICWMKSYYYPEDEMDDDLDVVVFELDDNSAKAWKRIRSLDGNAVFVGGSPTPTAVCVDSADLQDPGLRDRIIITRTALSSKGSYEVAMLYDLVKGKYDTEKIYTWPQKVFNNTLGWFMPYLYPPPPTIH